MCGAVRVMNLHKIVGLGSTNLVKTNHRLSMLSETFNCVRKKDYH